MNEPSKRTTIYLDPYLYRALRLKAATADRSVSDLVNEALRESLAEDAEDIAAFESRLNEPLVSYEAMIKKLKADGRI
ncbi:MAG: ribbon-helix-helix protein, CopG family [Dehalogenimonas sp.]|jgi:plasmid stability protein|uniref:Ribbon-helix-helix protein, CopG family n=1 Tax=Candidatus Dehalogenimonas loeffleri TaxID=3127115 RepID=A0ABZ2J4X2_9CHLR|nr:ribbon-helix-helix protein, CopG family [Dehalogenimonas sp.]